LQKKKKEKGTYLASSKSEVHLQ